MPKPSTINTYPPIPTKLSPPQGGGAPPGTTTGEPYYPPVPTSIVTAGNVGGTQSDTSGAAFNRQDFIKNYANMVARTWTDDSFLQLILSDPVDTLAQAGLPTIPGAVIRIVQHQITGTGRIEDEVDAWVAGNSSGLYDLFLPMKPDYVDFSGGAAGGADSASGGASCCCSPCCCCT